MSNKYHNRKATYDGEQFDSLTELSRWKELLLIQRAGEIKDLRRQVPYELIPTQKINGKVTEKSCKYIADFVYTDKSGKTIVEDVKGVKTAEYIIKRKLMLKVHGVEIFETR